MSRPTASLFTELRQLVSETTRHLEIRYVPLRMFVDHAVFLHTDLQSFEKISGWSMHMVSVRI